MTVDEAAAELYGLDPGDFLAARKARAAAARAAGDAASAASIGRLRKPTAVAWALNQLARTHSAEVAELSVLAGRIAAALESPAGERIRALDVARQALVRKLTGLAHQLAAERGVRLGAGAERSLADTLRAAVADGAVAAQLRAGRLTGAVEYEGFGLPTAVAELDDARTTEARAAVLRAERAYAESVAEAERRSAAVEVAASRANRLRAELRKAEDAEANAMRAHVAAVAEVESRRRAVQDARRLLADG